MDKNAQVKFSANGKKNSLLMYIIAGVLIVGVGAFLAEAGKGYYHQIAGDKDHWLGRMLPSSTVVTEASVLEEKIDQSSGVLEFRETDKATTGYWAFYTGEWGGASSKTRVYPTITSMIVAEGTDNTGSVIVDDTAQNDTGSNRVSVGDVVKVYPSGASYFFAPWSLNINSDPTTAPEVETYAIGATTDLVITCYNDKGTTELTADDNTNNTADYNGGSIGAGETYTYKCDIKNNIADYSKFLGAICTYYCGGEIDNFELQSDKWTELSGIPNGVLGDSFTHYDDSNQTTSCNFRHCYVPADGDYLYLKEWASTELYDFVLTADGTTQPSANGDSYCGFSVFDYHCEKAKSGAMVCDWYKHDDNGDPGELGLDEAPETTGYRSLDVGVAIEPQ